MGKEAGQADIPLDGNHPWGLPEQVPGEHSQAGPHLQGLVPRAEPGGFHLAPSHVLVHEEMLAQGSGWSDAEGEEQGLEVGDLHRQAMGLARANIYATPAVERSKEERMAAKGKTTPKEEKKKEYYSGKERKEQRKRM